jgi:hypothetical protein
MKMQSEVITGDGKAVKVNISQMPFPFKYICPLLLLSLVVASCQPASPIPNGQVTTKGPAQTTPTKFPALEPTSTEIPNIAPQVTATAMAVEQIIMAIQEPRLYQTYPSPDSKWQAKVIIYDCIKADGLEAEIAYEQLNLIQAANGEARTVDSQLRFCQGLGAFGLIGRFWSPNSRFFYYSDAREGGPDGGCAYWEPPLFRLDTTLMSKETLGMGSLSPDGKKLATWQGQELVISDIDTGESGRIPAIATDANIGPIAWSPDSQAFVYLQNTSICPSSSDKSYVTRVDLPEFKQTLLLESQTPIYVGVKWDTPGGLRLFDTNGNESFYCLTC